MIRAEFNIRHGSFTIKGHSGSAESGQDIICAAVSSAAYMAVNTITEILGVDVEASVRDGYMKATISGSNQAATDILRGLELHVSELSKDYPDFIKIITEV